MVIMIVIVIIFESLARDVAAQDFAYPMLAVVCENWLKSCSSLEDTRRDQENAQIPRPMCVEVLWMISMEDQSNGWWVMNSLSDEEEEKKFVCGGQLM